MHKGTVPSVPRDLFPPESSSRNESCPPADIAPLIPTAAYDTYWRFAAERQNIFFRRFEGSPPPWTDDPILRTYKFTNTYRASDRVSQYLIRRVIYRPDLPGDNAEVAFRTLLFKLFNKIETWELLETALGPLTFAEFSFKRYDQVLGRAMARGQSIYSAAYIMPSGGSLGHERKHRNHLTLIERMLKDSLPARLAEAGSMQRAFGLIRSYPTIGDFLAYQYVTDINYTEITDFSETEFVVPGPGSIDGIRKCFRDTAGLSEADVIRFMADRQEAEFRRLGLNFRNLWGRRLQLIDCQNIFCEVDKYSRVYHPELDGVSGRTQIKQKFRPNTDPIEYWFPPKWGINDLIVSRSLDGVVSHAQLSPSPAMEAPMDFRTYQSMASDTDRNPETEEKGMMIPLLGLAGEAGELLTEYKKFLRDGESHTQFRDRFAEELGDMLWYMTNVATKVGLDMQDIAQGNLAKCNRRWGPLPSRPAFDEGYPENERFPRRFLIDFATTHDQDEKPRVLVYYKGKPFGDPLTDNSEVPDGYAFHDAIHLAFTAVLGWSPLNRKLMDAKRKSNPTVDVIQDGARAKYIEEALSTMIFAYAKDHNWLEGNASVSSELLRMIRKMTAHLEVGSCTEGEWERAIVQGFSAWRDIKTRGSGTLVVDLDERTIKFKDS
jgi:NTP pyrophosphatase (non-canonical NTP hydrolase)